MLEVAYREEDPDSVILGVCSSLFRGLLAKVRAELATAKQENEGKDAKIVRLTGELNNLMIYNDMMKSNLGEKDVENEQLKEQVANLQEAIRVKDADLNKLQADLGKMTEEREDFRRSRNQNSKNLRRANEKLKRTEEVS